MAFITERIARVLKTCGPTKTAVFEISKALYKLWHISPLCKFRLYDIMKRCFLLLSRFVVVKCFELFWSAGHLLGVPLSWNTSKLSFRYSSLWMSKRKLNKAVWETESFIYKLKSVKATFSWFKFLNVYSFLIHTKTWNSNGEL